MNSDDKNKQTAEVVEDKKEKCFVIMPIGELDGIYPKDHFRHVYEDIFKPAIEKAGYEAYRVDYNKSSSLIQVEIVKEIVESPMVLCDLSTRNPNVLFELGIRQAYDKPVVLVQETGTQRIFDISTINTIEYRKERIFHEVIEDREKVYETIIATQKDSSYNSIIKMLQISQASLSDNPKMDANQETRLMLKTLMRDVADLRQSNSRNQFIEKYKLNNIELNDIKRFNVYDDEEMKAKEIHDFALSVTDKQFNTLSAKRKNEYINKAKEYVNYLYNSSFDNDKVKNELIGFLLKFADDNEIK